MHNYCIDLRYDLAWLVSQGLGRSMTGEYVTKKFEQEFCGMALTWGKKMKIFVKIFVNTYQKVNSAGRILIILIILIIKGLGRSISWIQIVLFSQPPLLLPTGLMNKLALVARMEVLHGFSNVDFHSPRLTVECLINLSAAKTNQQWAPSKTPLPGVTGQLPEGMLIIMDHFPLCKKQHFVLNKMNT